MFSFYNMILMMSFFRQLPESLVESARIDGASHFTVFRKVILPLSPPIIATVALFVGVNYWNDWYAPAYYILDEELIPCPRRAAADERSGGSSRSWRGFTASCRCVPPSRWNPCVMRR